jgi:biotin-(acetyl-CoA carboxylase) ligase
MLAANDRRPDDNTPTNRSALATIGQTVQVELGDSVVVGRALDVLADGRLVVLDQCGITHRFDTGDVIHLHS